MNVIYLIINKLLNEQTSSVLFKFDEILDILKESYGYDDIEQFVHDVDNANKINSGNPYFKDAVLHLYKKSKF